jgi:hypothetical protein
MLSKPLPRVIFQDATTMKILLRVLGIASFAMLLMASAPTAIPRRDVSFMEFQQLNRENATESERAVADFQVVPSGEDPLRATIDGEIRVLCRFSGDPPEEYKVADAADLGVKFVSEKRDAKTGFIVAGKNPTSLIKALHEINGRSIADLEKDMRPGAKSDVGSDKGFLGGDEALLAVMAADNGHVVDELGLTHQELARHLRVVAAIGLKRLTIAQKAKKALGAEPFTYQGRKFTVSFQFYRGDQPSPFNDGTKTDTDVTLTNVDSGKVLNYSLLVPDMIERYGFYEGTGTPYRVAPRDIIAVLDFLKPNDRAR